MLKQSLNLRTVLKYLFVAVIVIGFVTYTLFQARLLLIGPVIEFTDTLEPTQTEQFVFLEGQAKNIVRITLNGRDIYTNKNGYFKETLILENGYTVATIEGTDRYGRTTTLTRTFIYTPS